MPIVLIVAVLCLTISPLPTDLMLCFLCGTLMLVLGVGLFSLGAETSMTPIGSYIGTAITKTKNLPFILIVAFVLGFAVTVSEPDLQVLAATVPHIDTTVLIVVVGVGVGFFLSVCMFRILAGLRLRVILIVAYAVVFILAAFSNPEFLSIAFDSGGVTTGPMTVPFILALGIGVSHVRSDKHAIADSFGLVALCSVGPILAVLVLGFFYHGSGEIVNDAIQSFPTTVDIARSYLSAIPHYLEETAIALLPIFVIFLLFQIFALKLTKRNFTKILIGLVYTYLGLVLFLTGVNVGFSALGNVLGATLASSEAKIILIPLSMLIGWFLISAEPAVAVLEKQIEEVSAGAISGKSIKISLSIAIALAMGMAMLRVLTGISILWFVVPGYAIALILSFFVPNIYTAIAFDSGGVASGPMTATFMLQFVIGASVAVGGNPLIEAFGLVAMVAMMPLISIQLVGFISELKKKPVEVEVTYADDEIIELWEVSA